MPELHRAERRMRTALSDFLGSLERVREITVDIDNNLSQALADPKVLLRHETVQCACTVILSGYFESFLGNVAEAFIRQLCSKAIPFNSLPLKIRTIHFRDGAEVLARAAKQDTASLKKDSSKVRLTESEQIARRMASVLSGSAYELIWEAFGETRSNPGPAILKEFLGRFDISGGWRELAQLTGLSELTMDAALESFIRIRNECAHSGTATKVPTPSEVRDYCDLLEKLASGIAKLLETHLGGSTFAQLPQQSSQATSSQ